MLNFLRKTEPRKSAAEALPGRCAPLATSDVHHHPADQL